MLLPRLSLVAHKIFMLMFMLMLAYDMSPVNESALLSYLEKQILLTSLVKSLLVMMLSRLALGDWIFITGLKVKWRRGERGSGEWGGLEWRTPDGLHGSTTWRGEVAAVLGDTDDGTLCVSGRSLVSSSSRWSSLVWVVHNIWKTRQVF